MLKRKFNTSAAIFLGRAHAAVPARTSVRPFTHPAGYQCIYITNLRNDSYSCHCLVARCGDSLACEASGMLIDWSKGHTHGGTETLMKGPFQKRCGRPVGYLGNIRIFFTETRQILAAEALASRNSRNRQPGAALSVRPREYACQ